MGTWEGRRALILSAAPCEDLEYVRVFLRENPGCLVLCADGGMKYAGQLGITPDVVVADFDSSREAIACRELVCLTPEKDDTDTQHSVSLAIERGAKDITLACATGGRLDHLLANLLLCESAYESGARADGHRPPEYSLPARRRPHAILPQTCETLYFIDPAGRQADRSHYAWSEVSAERRGINPPLSVSVSNEAVYEQFSIEIGQGRALVIFAEDIPGIL